MDEKKHKCPPHHWAIDSGNVGRCKYCPAVKDFGKELRKWSKGHKQLPLVIGEANRGRKDG